MMTNTRLQLGYRDNRSLDIVVPGAITQAQIDSITKNLAQGQRIVAGSNPAASPLVAPSPESMHTDDEPTLDLHIDELATMLSTAKWEQIMPPASRKHDQALDLQDDDEPPGPTPGA